MALKLRTENNLRGVLKAWTVALTVPLLLVIVSLNFWIYTRGTNNLRLQTTPAQGMTVSRAKTEEAVSSLFRELDFWAQQVFYSATVGGLGLILAGGMVVSFWQRRWARKARQSVQQLDDLSSQLELTKIEAQRYRSEKSRLEETLQSLQNDLERRVEDRTANLSRNCEALEKELNSKRQAEKALTFQAKELERSKDVLEMHVQARTKELQKLKSRYELILNSAGEGIYGLDLQGKTTFVNPAAAKLSGWDIEEVIGRNEHEIFYGMNQAPTGPEEPVKMDSSGNHLGEQLFQRKDGTSFPVEYVRTPITENGRLFGAVVIFKDITERKRTEDALAHKASELSRSNAELEQFAYVASHDLQEPLRKVQAFGDRLKGKCQDALPKEGLDYLSRMLSAAARMQTLINDLLTFSRVISTSQPFVPVDLNVIARDVLSDLELRIEQTQAKVDLALLPTLDADPTQMRQLLQNLIGNALKFHAPERAPHVKVRAEIRAKPFTGGDGDPEEQLCDLFIEDNGIGFEERYVEKIFAVFQRLHGRSEYEGTGVGLAVCRRIIDRHGGSIRAEGRPGQGATFIITLPMKQALKEPKS